MDISSVQCETLFNTGFSEVVGLPEQLGLQSAMKLSFPDGERVQMSRWTVPNDRSSNAETSFVEFRCCSQHGQSYTFRRTETDLTGQICAYTMWTRTCSCVLDVIELTENRDDYYY